VAVAAATGASSTIARLLPYGVALALLAAGIYQFTPLKSRCLTVCQSPLGFLMGHWRPGAVGTLRMALDHSLYCLGCCAGLMVVLVAAGAMSLPWALLIAAEDRLIWGAIGLVALLLAILLVTPLFRQLPARDRR